MRKGKKKGQGGKGREKGGRERGKEKGGEREGMNHSLTASIPGKLKHAGTQGTERSLTPALTSPVPLSLCHLDEEVSLSSFHRHHECQWMMVRMVDIGARGVCATKLHLQP